VCWFFGSLVGFLPVFGWHNAHKSNWAENKQCYFTEIMDYNYLVFLYFTTIITPSVILIVFYGLIYRVILKLVYKTPSSLHVSPSTRHHTFNSPPIDNDTQIMRMLNSAAQKREVKATQNLSIIVVFFMICWIPLYTINCVNAFCDSCFVNEAATYFSIILSHLNSAINPLLYAYHLKVSLEDA
jgi:adenosine receptor A2a